VLNQSDHGAIRALFERGVPKKVIARELDIDIKTVRKHLRQPWTTQQRPSARGRALDRFGDFVAARAPEVGFNAVVLHRELRGLGFEGAYTTLVEYLRPLRLEHRGDPDPTPRFETDPGQQAQVDWGSTAVWIGDDHRRVHVFVFTLGFSRRLFAKAYFNERTDALLDGHAEAFAHFGGRTEQILYDNPRTIVLSKDEETGDVAWNKTFKDRMDFYGVDVRLCRYYRAQTKGKVESGVKYVKRNALAGRRFRSLEELNAWLLEWCVTIADRRIHGTTHERPADRFARAEAGALVPVDARRPTPRERVEHRVVPRDTYVLVETNRYPVRLEWVGRRVEVRLLPEEVVISGPSGEPVMHARLAGKHGIAGWEGAPRDWKRAAATARTAGPPRLDPSYYGEAGVVEPRALECYEAMLEEVLV
jgi:transposase